MRSVLLFVICSGVGMLMWGGCDTVTETLAPYEGERPLKLMAVTQSFTPEIQWVGGRIAVVGVNRGNRAALDSTLVWMMTAEDNTIGSHVTVGSQTDEEAVRSYGGTPVDSLADGTEYTFWLAEKSALDAGLNTTQLDSFSFADTTLTMALRLRGTARVHGDLGVELQITRDQTLTGETYTISWTPATVPFRRVAIRRGAGSPAFTDLVWHVVLPDSVEDNIYSPVVIGEPPPGTQVAVPWEGTGFDPSTYVVWMTNSDWEGDFGFRPRGMAYFIVFDTNFIN